MNDSNRKSNSGASPEPRDAGEDRRRIGKIVHDERGSASLEWRDAPDDYDRPKLEIEDPLARTRKLKKLENADLGIASGDTFNPYDRGNPDATMGGTRRDLRKLSEWIKMMREREASKGAGETDDEKD